MTTIYESSFGIYNHIANQKNPPANRRPLAAVAFHRGEDFTTGSLLEDTMKVYEDLPIYELTKMPYDVFMKQSVDVFNMWIDRARAKKERDDKAAMAANQNLQRAMQEQSVANRLMAKRAQSKQRH